MASPGTQEAMNRARQMLTAVINDDYTVALMLQQEAPRPDLLVETTFMLCKHIITLWAINNGQGHDVPGFWARFNLQMEGGDPWG